MNAPASYPQFPNKAHQRAYLDGIAAAEAGKVRFPPYDCSNRSSLHFRKAWLAGYDGASERAGGSL
jgi:hypothetical protein